MREKLQLINDRFINPYKMQSFVKTRLIKQSQTFEACGFSFKLSMDTKIEDGTEIEVFMGFDGFFYAEPVADIEEKLAKLKKEAEDRERVRQEMLEAQVLEAKTFNEALLPDVKWVPAIKDVVSGLTERSDGSGKNKRTVIHVLLKEDVSKGRLHRLAGHFLCSSNALQNGNNYTDTGREYTSSKVTCKACLKIIASLKD